MLLVLGKAYYNLEDYEHVVSTLSRVEVVTFRNESNLLIGKALFNLGEYSQSIRYLADVKAPLASEPDLRPDAAEVIAKAKANLNQ